MRSANSVQLSYISIVGGWICGKVSISRCTGIERSTRRVTRIPFHNQLAEVFNVFAYEYTGLLRVLLGERLKYRPVHFGKFVSAYTNLQHTDQGACLDTQ